LVTPDVDVESYAEPLVENVHYIRIEKPDDITSVIRDIDEETRERMSKSCIEWWERNIGIVGSFKTTLSQVFGGV